MGNRFIRTRATDYSSPDKDFHGDSSAHTQQIPTLNSLSRSLGNQASTQDALDHSLEWVLKLTGADAGCIFVLDEDSGALVLSARKGFGPRFDDVCGAVDSRRGLHGEVVRSGGFVLVDDLSADRRALQVVLDDGMMSYLGVPLSRSAGDVVGVLSVFSRKRSAFSRTDVELLRSLETEIAQVISNRKPATIESQSGEDLGRKMNQLSELIRVSSDFQATKPLDEVLQTICSTISTTLGFGLVELSLLDADSGMMLPSAFAGFSTEEVERIKRIRRPIEFYARVMHPKFRISNSYFLSHEDSPYSPDEWAFLPDIDDSQRGRDEWHQNDTLAVPLHNRDGMLIGMLYVDDPTNGQLPTFEQVQMLEMFVQQSSLAIENARLIEELTKSEAKYRLLTENATDLIFLLEPDGAISFMSSSAKRVLGYDPADLIGKGFSDILSPTSRRLSPNYLLTPDMTQELQGRCEVEVLRSDGSSAFLEINSTPVFENGKLVGEQGIARDISEKKRMEKEIARRQRQLRRSQKRQEQLTGYAATVIAAQEDERRRIARDLHDDTAQALIALSRQIESVREVFKASPAEADQKLRELKGLTDQTLKSVRQFSRDLRPSMLDDLGLVPALEWLVSENARRYKITTRLKINGEECRLPSEVELTCFRIAQESLNNSAKHAEATGAAVELYFGTGWFRLMVSDNGKGFDFPPVPSELAGKGRMGVMGMHERASLLGGNLVIRTAPGQGTRVSVTIPLTEDS